MLGNFCLPSGPRLPVCVCTQDLSTECTHHDKQVYVLPRRQKEGRVKGRSFVLNLQTTWFFSCAAGCFEVDMHVECKVWIADTCIPLITVSGESAQTLHTCPESAACPTSCLHLTVGLVALWKPSCLLNCSVQASTDLAPSQFPPNTQIWYPGLQFYL